MNPCCPPFAQPCDACDEAEVRVLVRGHVRWEPQPHGFDVLMGWNARHEWRRLASHCGAHPDDMRGFIEGLCSLTPQNRRAIRERLASEGA